MYYVFKTIILKEIFREILMVVFNPLELNIPYK